VDYKKHYINLIKTRYNRKREQNVYYEKHHIIPKCLGGSNKKENIVYLTPREHYLAHWLLYRIRPYSNKLSYSFWIMNWPGNKKVKRQYTISSRMYEEARNAMRETNKKKMNSNNHTKGITLSQEHRNKISESCKGKRNTLEQLKKQSLAQMKPINQFTKDGIFIKKWDSQKSIFESLGIMSAGNVCKGNRKTAGGYVWKWA
jgi:hypothetical protein